LTRVWRDRLTLAAPIGVALILLAGSPCDDGPTLCPFALMTGTACPGCGMTRAASLLIRGDVGGAIGYHPLIPLIAILAIGGWTWFLLVRSGRARPPTSQTVNAMLITTGVLLVAVWLARLVSGSLPSV
jgi:Protein of unknown function (DUF2752)